MAYPFECITEFMFVETVLEPADVILIPGGSHPQSWFANPTMPGGPC